MTRIGFLVWVSPVTFLGVILAMLGWVSGGTIRRGEGVLEAFGGGLGWLLSCRFPFCGPVAAMTLGHVIVALSDDALTATRAHEHVHVRQFERWGLLFLAVYPLAGMKAWLLGGNPYWDNVFEREARAGANQERED